MSLTKDKKGYLVYRELPLRGQKEHRVIAEKVLGRKLKTKEVVHHIDGCKTNNNNSNLLICTDEYHRLIHKRMRILELGGNPNTDKYCPSCKTVKSKLDFYNTSKVSYCLVCSRIKETARRERRKEYYKNYFHIQRSG